VYFAIRNRARESITTDELDERLSDYDRILYEWNDALNVNLAMIGTYFGQHARDSLAQAYEIYRDVGSELEIAYRAAADEMQPVRLDELNRQLEMLNDTAYRISLFMMTQLREGNVGRHAEQPVATPQLLG